MDAQTKNESGEFQGIGWDGNTPTIDESQGGRVGMPRCVDMHFEQNDGVVSDVEAVSQESRGSGATLGESLRSLDVEIGSADGQDDGGKRQGPRIINALLGYTSDEPRDGVAGSAPIDTAFLDALPEKLLAEVLSGRQCQVAQPPNIEPQNDGDIDLEFFAALPPAIRADVLAQQQAQGGKFEFQLRLQEFIELGSGANKLPVVKYS
uniref:E3 ubiquitin-protein ligase UPL2-like n=1 Tax=Tanacetum cinerariifolium TaxID=118510 RepID=A0A699IRA1_TANCI|nr:E3 ubiquitin-protein ligase UPL2-like [Tanacetum cinerariifolium]